MTRKDYESRRQFEDILAGESKRYGARTLAQLLCRHGVTYSRIQEANCNGCGTWYGESNESFNKRQERFEKQLEHKEQLLEKRIRAIVSELGEGFGVIFHGDPRGSTIKITVPSGRTNDWGKEGICVPTA